MDATHVECGYKGGAEYTHNDRPQEGRQCGSNTKPAPRPPTREEQTQRGQEGAGAGTVPAADADIYHAPDGGGGRCQPNHSPDRSVEDDPPGVRQGGQPWTEWPGWEAGGDEGGHGVKKKVKMDRSDDGVGNRLGELKAGNGGKEGQMKPRAWVHQEQKKDPVNKSKLGGDLEGERVGEKWMVGPGACPSPILSM